MVKSDQKEHHLINAAGLLEARQNFDKLRMPIPSVVSLFVHPKQGSYGREEYTPLEIR